LADDVTGFLDRKFFWLGFIDNILRKTSQQEAPAAKAQGLLF
jgi:hypothetical protein